MSERDHCCDISVDAEQGKEMTDSTLITSPFLKRRAVDSSLDSPTDDVRRNTKRLRTGSSDGGSPGPDLKITPVSTPELNCEAQSHQTTHEGTSSFQVGKKDTDPHLSLQQCDGSEGKSLPTTGVKVETLVTKGDQAEIRPTSLEYGVGILSAQTGNKAKNVVLDGIATSSGTRPQTAPSRVHCSDETKKPFLLPLELHEYILELFWDDIEVTHIGLGKSVTRKCRQVCSRWYAAARPHLFRNIVIASEKRLAGLASLIQDDPSIAQWIRRFSLRGITMPLHPTGARQPDDAEEDRDKWLYPFPSCFNAPLPSVRTLDLDGFANVSRRPEDCKAFAQWVRDLSIMTSIDRINFDNCEMSSNSATSLMRAFPRLQTLEFHGVDFTRPNIGILVDTSLGPICLDPPRTAPSTVTETQNSSKNNNLLEESVQYPLLHPPPRLRRIHARNYTNFQLFDFNLLRGLLCPKTLSKSLRVLEIGYHVNTKSLSTFIADLGTSATLENLRLHVGRHRHPFVDCNVDISLLANLRELTLLGDLISTTEISVNSRQLLSQVDATQLKRVNFIIYYNQRYNQHQLLGVDDDLAQEKFKNLETISVHLITETYDVLAPKKRWSLFQPLIPKVTKFFPLAEKRKIFRIFDLYDL